MSAVTLWGSPYRGLGARGRIDPFGEFDALVRRTFPTATTEPGHGFTPAADVVREGDDAVVRLELPGVDVAEDVTVEVDHDRLVVRGERRDEHTDDGSDGSDGRGWHREVRYGSFRRSFRLPAHVDAAAVSASYDAGVLTVRVAGAHAETEPARIPVDHGAGAQPTTEAGSTEAGSTEAGSTEAGSTEADQA